MFTHFLDPTYQICTSLEITILELWSAVSWFYDPFQMIIQVSIYERGRSFLRSNTLVISHIFSFANTDACCHDQS